MRRWDDDVLVLIVLIIVLLAAYVAGVYCGIRWYDREIRPLLVNPERCE